MKRDGKIEMEMREKNCIEQKKTEATLTMNINRNKRC